MAAGILKSDKAIQMNIAIVKAFIALRKFIIQYNDLLGQLKELKDKVRNHDKQLNQIFYVSEKLLNEKADQQSWREREKIGFKNRQ